MALMESWVNCYLGDLVKIQYLEGNVFNMDNQANLVGVNVYDADGNPANITGVVSGHVIRADGNTVVVSDGVYEGNKCWITLPQAAYACVGTIIIAIKLTSGSTITTLACVVSNVYQSMTGNAVDPGTLIPSIEDLISAIDTARATWPVDYSTLWTTIAPAFSTETSYIPGQYVTYDAKMYRFTAVHTAGSWNSGHVIQVNVGSELGRNVDILSADIVKTGNPIFVPDNSENRFRSISIGTATKMRVVNADYNVIRSKRIRTVRGITFVNTRKGIMHISGKIDDPANIGNYWDGAGFSMPSNLKKPFVHGTGQTIKFGFTVQKTKSITGSPKISIIISSMEDSSVQTTLYQTALDTDDALVQGNVSFTCTSGVDYTLSMSLDFAGLSDGTDIGVVTLWMGAVESSESVTFYRLYSNSDYAKALLFDNSIAFVNPSQEISATYKTIYGKQFNKPESYLTFRTVGSKRRACCNMLIDEESRTAIFFDLSDSTNNALIVNLAKIYHIKAVVISHFHYDHIGMDPVSGEYNDDTFFTSLKPYMTSDCMWYIQKRPEGLTSGEGMWDSAVALLTSCSIDYTIVSTELMKVQIGEAELIFLNTDYNYYNEGEYGGYNNTSLCAYAKYGEGSVLVTGDIYVPTEEALYENKKLSRATILQAPHHGMATKVSSHFMDAVLPKVIIMNFGTSTDSSLNTATTQRGNMSAIKVWGEAHPEVEIYDTYENNTFDILLYKDGNVDCNDLMNYKNTGIITTYSNVRDAINYTTNEDNITDEGSATLTLNTLLLRMPRNSKINCMVYSGYKIAQDIFEEAFGTPNDTKVVLEVQKLVGAISDNIFNRGAAVEMSSLTDGSFMYKVTAYVANDTKIKREIFGYYWSSGTTDVEKWQDRYICDSSNIENTLTNITENEIITGWSENHYLITNGESVDVTNIKDHSTMRYVVVPCSAGDIFTVNVKGATTARAWSFIESDGTIIQPNAAASVTTNELVLIAPTDSAYLVLNDTKIDGSWNSVSYKGYHIPKKFNDVDKADLADTEYETKIADLLQNGYMFLDFGEYTENTILRATTGEVYAGTGTGNNFVYEKYIKIPKGNIYFSMKSDCQMRLCLYDEKFNCIGVYPTDNNNWDATPYGTVYNNTSATYMRVSIYRSGGPVENDFCYAYYYDEMAIKNNQKYIYPLFQNLTSAGAKAASQVISGYIKSDLPVVIKLADAENYRLYVRLLDDDYNTIRSFTYTDLETYSYVSVPSNMCFWICIKKASGEQVSARDILEQVTIERRKNNLGIHSFLTNPMKSYLNKSKERIGNIDMLYTSVPLKVICDDVSAYAYHLSLYNSYGNPYSCLVKYDSDYDMIIPPNTFYRYIITPIGAESVAFDDMEAVAQHIHFVPIAQNTREAEALMTADGLTRQLFDTDVMPTYYADHMTSKIATINTLKTSCATQFGFITDYHFGTYDNAHTVRPLLTELVKQTNVGMLFNGGDIWTAGVSDDRTFGFAKQRLISGVQETRPNAPCECYYVFGNHDTGLDYDSVGGQTVRHGPWMTIPEVKEIIGNVSGQNIIYDPASQGLSYYFDKGNFRYVVLDRYMSYVDLNNEAADDSYSFLIESLLSAGSKTIVLFTHLYIRSSAQTVTDKLASIIIAYNARQSLAKGVPDNFVAVDFADCTGKVCCWISGHTHSDSNTTLSDGTPVIMTTTCNAGAELGSLDRTVGTVNENAFDVFSIDTTNKMIYATRIGAGSDREFSYASEDDNNE